MTRGTELAPGVLVPDGRFTPAPLASENRGGQARALLAQVIAGAGRVEGQDVCRLGDVDAGAAQVLGHLVERRPALLVPGRIVLQHQAELAEGFAIAGG